MLLLLIPLLSRASPPADVVIPACGDLVSLSIDIWMTGEDMDGERLVVASDIGMRPLILADLQPPPLCRYLKV